MIIIGVDFRPEFQQINRRAHNFAPSVRHFPGLSVLRILRQLTAPRSGIECPSSDHVGVFVAYLRAALSALAATLLEAGDFS